MTDTPRSSRRGGRAARHSLRESQAANAALAPYVARKIPLTELCSEEGLEIIEANADTLLQEIGIDFKGDPEVLSMWKDAGADVDGERVRFDKGLVRSLLSTAPETYVQHARNPANNAQIARQPPNVLASLTADHLGR